MTGYRTLIVAVVSVVSGLLEVLGYGPIPTGDQETVAGAVMIVLGLVFGVLRVVTTTPVGEKE